MDFGPCDFIKFNSQSIFAFKLFINLFSEDFISKSHNSKFLDKHVPPNFGKFLCHSFRAGLPSAMATKPNLLTQEEIMEVGRWSSEAFLRYTRLYGLRAKAISEKLCETL